MDTLRWVGLPSLLLLAQAAAPGLAEDKMTIRYQLPPGQYDLVMTSRADGTTTVAGNATAVRNVSKNVWSLTVPPAAGKDEKKARLRLTAASTEGTEGGQDYKYDSTAGEPRDEQRGEHAFVYQPLLRTDVTLTLDADDTVVEVAGLDQLWARLEGQAQTPAQKALLAEHKLALGDKMFEAAFRRLEALMPRDAVAVGDTWKAGLRLDLPVVGEIKARFDCRLAGREKAGDDTLAVIEAACKYQLASPRTVQVEGVSLTFQALDMEEKARLKVQVRTGLVVLDENTRVVKTHAKAVQDGKDLEVTGTTTTRNRTTLTPAGEKPAASGDPTPAPGTTPPAARKEPGTTPAGAARTAGKKPLTLVLRRQWEPNQKAFTVLVPDGWLVKGGLYSVDPSRAGGALNSIDTKCDFAVQRDRAGSVMVRWAPSTNFVDFSRAPEFAQMAALFPPGRVYNGAPVKPLPTCEEFLLEGLKTLRPQAAGVRAVQRAPVPELAAILQQLARPVNESLVRMGKPGMTFTAAGVVFDYVEGGVPYREGGVTALCDLRGAAGLWSNQFTVHMRAPAAEADDWKPVCEIIRQSLQINPEWLAAYVKAVGERGRMTADLFRRLARLDQEIFENRSRVRSEIANDNYLLLTGQEEFVNPYTREVERDASDYRHRWTTQGGDRLYTDQPDLDPNRHPDLGRAEWKRTPVRPR